MAEKILIVDDDHDTLEVMSLYLSRLGYQVITASSGIEALDLAHKDLPDLIVLDVMMPGMDGFEVARNLHRTADTATIPILMVTARNTDEDKEKGYDSGVDIYLTKPLHRMDFQANIKSLLLQRRAKKMAVSDQGFLIGVLAAKGGLGVSSVALNLAVTYARKNSVKVIAAELRPGHGTWADELDLDNNEGLDRLLAMEPFSITPAVVENQLMATNHGMRLLLASSVGGGERAARGSAHYEAILASLGSLAPVVVLDVGPHTAASFPAVVNQCAELMVVTEPQPLAVKQTARLLDLLRPAGFGTAKPLTVISLNHTRSDTIMSVSQMEEALSRSVAIGFPPALELAWQAQRSGVPMSVQAPDSLTGQQYTKLAEQVQKHIANR